MPIFKPNIDPAIRKALEGLSDDFDEFAEVFQNEIQPTLIEREHDRIRAADKARKSLWVGILVGAAGVAISLLIARVPLAAVISGLVGAGIAGFGRMEITRLGKEAKSLIVEPFATKLGHSYVAQPGRVEDIYDFKSVKLVGRWDRSNFEDYLSGTRNGVDFRFFEAHLEEKQTTRDSNGSTRTKWVTVFRGQCLRFNFHKTFYGKTIVSRDMGFFNRFGGGGGFQRAILESPDFEKAFEVYTTDQVEARYILTPDFMQKLVDLETVFRGKNLKCAFAGGEMLIAVESGDLFEPGSMFKPLDDPMRMRDLLNDFASIYMLMDSAAKNRETEGEKRSEAPPSQAGGSVWGRFFGKSE